jgi:DNA-binding MarR family transcriptional regulator
MTKKEKFIAEIEEALNTSLTLSTGAQAYFEELKASKAAGPVTETGIKILQYMQENTTKYLNLFTAKVIGEALFMNSKSVSGSMRKLVTDGYVKKEGTNPVTYSLTENGIYYII